MQQTPDTNEEFSQSSTSAQKVGAETPETISPAGELSTLLGRAADLAASMGLDLDAWMRSAWSSYVDARPGLREHLADMQLIEDLEALRKNGRIGQA